MKILFTGDYCPIGRTESFLKDENYTDLFNGFNKINETVDYSVVNFECTLTLSNNKIIKTGPCLKSENLNAMKALKYAGFNMLTLANNHIQDYGNKGVIDTIISAKRLKFDTVGAGSEQASAASPLIKTIQGLKIGFVNIAENEFCAAKTSLAGANTFNLIENSHVIEDLKKKVDKIILIYHGGREHYQLPTPRQRKRLRHFIDVGVDAIVAHHTHCISGFEYYKNKPIVYSLGNFIFDYKKKYQKGLWTEGISVILSLENEFKINQVIPHFQGRTNDSSLQLMTGAERHRVLKKVTELSEIIVDDSKFMQSWNDYLKTQENFYLSSIYVRNLYLRALFMKGILPISLLKSKHSRLMLNLIRCETHREISEAILENQVDNER